MPHFTLDEQVSEAKSRFALLQLLRLNLRLMENWREIQRKGGEKVYDYETTLILIAITIIRSGQLLSSSTCEMTLTLENEVPAELLQKCNISSIAATTSLNRETVRRRVAMLVEDGVVKRDPGGGVRLAEGVLQRPELREGLRAQLQAVRKTADELVKSGILVIEDGDG